MKTVDAYRYFFPAGWLLGLWGVSLWLLFPLDLLAYPGSLHPQIMMGGFFLCFVCGFLMTAAPRFTASFPPTRLDIWISGFLLAALFLSVLSMKILFFHLTTLMLLLFLVIFFVRRFLHRTQSPPDAFLFVGVGMGIALVGVTLLICGDLGWNHDSWLSLGRLFFLQGYILALVLGVGSRLVPALLGRGPMPTETLRSSSLKLFAVLAFAFLLSYFIEAFSANLIGPFLRSFVVTWIIFYFWKIHLLPVKKGHQAFWLWVSAWSLLVGQWGTTLWPAYRLHFLHLIFISGLGLMTLMIATRVTLSHGGHDTGLEKNSKALLIGGVLLVAAALTRVSAGFSSRIYQSHLIYASCAWLVGLVVWGWVYLPKMIFLKQDQD